MTPLKEWGGVSQWKQPVQSLRKERGGAFVFCVQSAEEGVECGEKALRRSQEGLDHESSFEHECTESCPHRWEFLSSFYGRGT